MVSWSDISESIRCNGRNTYCVPSITVTACGGYERFPLRGKAEVRAVVRAPEQEAPVKSDALPSPPPPPVVSALKEKESPRRITIRVLKKLLDPIALGIEHRDALYDGAPHTTRARMECEEAELMEKRLDELYKSEGGRSRGWTKTGIDRFIKPRCASGGDIRALDRVKCGFAWNLLREDKPLSAFLDFLCLAKGIRVAVWFQETKHIIIYPAADKYGSSATEYPLYHMDSTGNVIHSGLHTCADLGTYANVEGFTLLPPASVIHSLSGLTLGELSSVATGLGIGSLEGTKLERVATIATFKLKQRLGV